MIEFLQKYAAELIAAFAAILAALANWRVVQAERRVRILQKAERRTDVLVEIEYQNAVIGKLALVTAQKIELLQRFPTVLSFTDSEMKRLHSNLDMLRTLKSQEEEQRKLGELAGGGNNVTLHHQALADIRRLRVRLEAELENETNHYSQLLEAARDKDT
ncbi:hypothetical protein [Gilvimarinus xylanilyticus]|uniref:Uncharacterized protein n=1 Tax=Gilvimarinus xylanilyticus TaxID=2944139 RepID=A0A9X2I1G6_9GAMM|nr:hypothetical protein [Gilvimarinus xylanilyticus]MCP8900376.1 hypothetical protein [Gilvimarinus xylanilyticus]